MSDHPSKVHDPETYAILGAAMEVHRELGHGFLEAVYQDALAREFSMRRIASRREAQIPVRYKGEPLETGYRADFICFERIIVELKALPRIGGNEQAQAINYLKATGFRVALVINFGEPRLDFRRLAL